MQEKLLAGFQLVFSYVDCSSAAQAAMTTAQAAYFFTQTRRGPAGARSSADASVQCALQLLGGVPAGLTKCR